MEPLLRLSGAEIERPARPVLAVVEDRREDREHGDQNYDLNCPRLCVRAEEGFAFQ